MFWKVFDWFNVGKSDGMWNKIIIHNIGQNKIDKTVAILSILTAVVVHFTFQVLFKFSLLVQNCNCKKKSNQISIILA